ncbi:retrovirus-related Pol polyprotein from transposon 297 [Trichonephila clavipes]|uniref:Retrovirus-related Pol polyprotein from transposon 297 n=1 Tax=Trichonephila clavipes TaxID=2585209 RepID=A0A8X6S7L1_TRICX|nr:retrovirus-related Pol polyprotein from transposon 297 [Trichonephila clavipes]
MPIPLGYRGHILVRENEMYTNEEYCKMVLLYGQCNRNKREAARLYAIKFPRRRHPSYCTIAIAVQRLYKTRSSCDPCQRAGIASLAAPLTELLKGKSKKGYINWTSECQESFVQLKEKLSTNHVLYAPDFKRQFILQSNASDTGVGIVLAQRNGRGEEHPILYLSKKFSDTEREKVYCTTEKECGAIVYAVKKLKCYRDGQQKFII